MRFSVYSTQYAHAFEGRYPLPTQKAVDTFPELFPDFNLSGEIKRIHQVKTGCVKDYDKKEEFRRALNFLEDLDEYLAKKYLEGDV